MIDRYFPGQRVRIVKTTDNYLLGAVGTIASERVLMKTTGHPNGVLRYRLKENHPLTGNGLIAAEDQLASVYDGNTRVSWEDFNKAVHWIPKDVDL